MRTAFAAASLALPLALPAPAALAQDYVNIGEYQGGIVETPAPYETVPLPAMPAPTYAEPVVYSDAPYTTLPVEAMPVETLTIRTMPVETLSLQTAPPQTLPVGTPAYRPPLAPGTGFAPDTGTADPDYEAARLAAYDTNGDGTITTAEAIATLRPLDGS